MIVRSTGTRRQLIDELMAVAASRRAQVRHQASHSDMSALAGEADGLELAVSYLRGWTDTEAASTAVAVALPMASGSAGGGCACSTGGSCSCAGGGGGQGGSAGASGAAPVSASGGTGGGGAAGPSGQCPGCGRALYLTHQVRVVHIDGTALCTQLPPGEYAAKLLGPAGLPDPGPGRQARQAASVAYRSYCLAHRRQVRWIPFPGWWIHDMDGRGDGRHTCEYLLKARAPEPLEGGVMTEPPMGETWLHVPLYLRPDDWADGIEVMEG